MLKALFWKETREAGGIALAALGAYALLLAGSTSQTLRPNVLSRVAPFIDDNFLLVFAIISLALAIALGLRQTLGESSRGTYPFLLHRPVSRNRIIGVKLAVGFALYLLCAAAPLLAYALWAAQPGTHDSPFEWWMTEFGWELWLSVSVLYGGAFVSGIRPGRWLGTRLWPLVAAIFVVIVVMSQATLGSPWWIVTVAPVDAVLVVVALHVAQSRDY